MSLPDARQAEARWAPGVDGFEAGLSPATISLPVFGRRLTTFAAAVCSALRLLLQLIVMGDPVNGGPENSKLFPGAVLITAPQRR